MPVQSPRRRLARAWPVLLALVLALPANAKAEACPGSGDAPACPYASAALLGERAESILRFPEAVAVDDAGNVYVADQLSYVVQKFNSNGEYIDAWGSYGGGHGQFGPIGGLATDAAGDVYVVDSEHDRIEKFGPNGEYIGDWGRKGHELGEFEFYSSQNYTQPPGGGIAVAGEYVYVADSGNNRIERFNLNGGEPLAWGSYGDGPGRLDYPRALAANANEVLVADPDDYRIERFTPNGEYEGSVGSHGEKGLRFTFPYGISLNAAGDVYVTDDANEGRVVKLNPQLGFADEWSGAGSDRLRFPRALASDPAGDTYVADTAEDRIEVFNPDGAYLRTLGTSAKADPGAFVAPRGVAVDPTGRVYVADPDANDIQYFAPGGGAFLGEWSATGGYKPAFYEPSALAFDPKGPVYVADTGNARVVKLWGEGEYLSELGSPADFGGAGLDDVASVAVSPQTGDLYVADSGHNRILVYSPNGTLIAKVGAEEGNGAAGSGPGQFDDPQAVTIAPSGNVFVADTDNNRIVELSQSGAYLNEFGRYGSGEGRLHTPTGVAVDAAGRVYVVDSFNDRIEVFSEAGQYLARWGLRGTDLGYFSQPSGDAVGCEGSVYVADTNNNRVERFDPAEPAGVGCAAPGAWPPPLNVAPVVSVSLLRRSGVLAERALALSVSCQRGCKILATATISPGAPSPGTAAGRRPAAGLIAEIRTLPPKRPGHVRLRVGANTLRRLRKALGRRSAMTAAVRIVAVGPTGLRTTLTRTYKVTR